MTFSACVYAKWRCANPRKWPEMEDSLRLIWLSRPNRLWCSLVSCNQLTFHIIFLSLWPAVLLTSWLEPKYCCFQGLDLHSYSYFYEIRARWIHLISFSGFYVGRIFMSIHLVPSSPQDTQNRDIMWSPLSWWEVAVRLMHHKPSELRGCLHDTGPTFKSPRSEFIPVPFHGSIFVYMIPPQNVMPARVTPAWVHPGSCTGARISLRYEISQRYHVNAKRPPVSVWNRSAGRVERVAHA